MSVMCSRPSTPPRSMKAPKSVMFFTIPLRTWPTWSSFIRTSRLVLRSASSSTRRDTTMLRRRLLSLMILNSKLWPSSSSMLGTRRSAIWLPGRNASTPMRSTTTPPLIFFTRVPDTASSRSCASRMRSHTRMKSAFFFERTTAPSWSSRCSRNTSTSSPSLSECASLNSSIGTAPSDLNPTSRMTAASVTRSTFDFTISPSSMFERVALALEVGGIDAVAALGQTAAGPLVRRRREKHLEGGVREHHRPDVPPVHHDALGMRPHGLALLHVDPVAHFGDGGDLRHARGHPRRADGVFHAHPRHLGPEHLAHEHQSHREVLRERHELLRTPRRAVAAAPFPGRFPFPGRLPEIVERRQRDRPIQRARVEMRPPEAPRHRRRGGRLSRRSRTIDGDDANAHVSRMLRRSAKNRG